MARRRLLMLLEVASWALVQARAVLYCMSQVGGFAGMRSMRDRHDMLPHPPMLSSSRLGVRCCWVGARERRCYC